jgi:hypothetical protein
MYSAIGISVVNSTYYVSPHLPIIINQNYGQVHKEYIVTASGPKVVIDLTAELVAVRWGEEIVSTGFVANGDPNDFYKDCVNILSNVFISYTYED